MQPLTLPRTVKGRRTYSYSLGTDTSRKIAATHGPQGKERGKIDTQRVKYLWKL
jgi:hypothetical protein